MLNCYRGNANIKDHSWRLSITKKIKKDFGEHLQYLDVLSTLSANYILQSSFQALLRAWNHSNLRWFIVPESVFARLDIELGVLSSWALSQKCRWHETSRANRSAAFCSRSHLSIWEFIKGCSIYVFTQLANRGNCKALQSVCRNRYRQKLKGEQSWAPNMAELLHSLTLTVSKRIQRND